MTEKAVRIALIIIFILSIFVLSYQLLDGIEDFIRYQDSEYYMPKPPSYNITHFYFPWAVKVGLIFLFMQEILHNVKAVKR